MRPVRISVPATRTSEPRPHRELKRSRVADRQHLAEGRRGAGRIGARAEVAVDGDHVRAVREVEPLDESFELQPIVHLEGPPDAHVQAEEVRTRAGVAWNELAIHDRT